MAAYPTFASANGFNPAFAQQCQKLIQHTFPITHEAGSEAAPNFPTGALKDALTHHVIRPLVGAVIAITVTLDCEPAIIFSLYNEVNTEIPNWNLRVDTEAALCKHIKHFSFKWRFTAFTTVSCRQPFAWKGNTEMFQQCAPQLIALAQPIEFD